MQALTRYQAHQSFRHFARYWQFRAREPAATPTLTFDALWPGQQVLVDVMQRARWLVDLKAGKQGHSELECAYDGYASWSGPPNNRVHIYSQKEDEAQEFLAIVRFGLTHLPRYFGVKLLADEPGGDATGSLKYSMGEDDTRTVVAYPAKPGAGINQSAWHVHMDELAHMQWGRRVYDAAATTVVPGGSLHVISRGAGADDHMATLWTSLVPDAASYPEVHAAALERAATDPKVMVPVFVPYTGRPGRDAAWRANEALVMTPSALRHYAPEVPDDALSGDDEGVFVDEGQWDALELSPALPEEPHGMPVVIGMDAGGVSQHAASAADHFALVGVTRHPERRDHIAIRFCIEWDPPVRFEDVKATLDSLRERYNVVCVTYDEYQLADLAQQYEARVWMEKFSQGARRMVADKALRDRIVQRRMTRIDHTGLRDAIRYAGVQTYRDEQAIRLTKRTAGKKIDPAVALSMAAQVCSELNL